MTHLKWLEDMRFAIKTDSGFSVVMDSSEENGGGDSGPRPMEMVIASLAGCTAMDVVSILKKMRQDIKGLEISIDSERSSEHPKVFTKIHLIFTVTGKELDESKVKRAIELSQDKYCSVSAMLKQSADVTYEYRIAGE